MLLKACLLSIITGEKSEVNSADGPVVGVSGGWEDVEVGYLVGRGATGSVYRATCNGHQVAVKVHRYICAYSICNLYICKIHCEYCMHVACIQCIYTGHVCWEWTHPHARVRMHIQVCISMHM